MSGKRRHFRFGPEHGLGSFPCILECNESGCRVKARVLNLSVLGIGFEIVHDPQGKVSFWSSFTVVCPDGRCPGHASLIHGKTVNVMRVNGLVAGTVLESPLMGGDEDALKKALGVN